MRSTKFWLILIGALLLLSAAAGAFLWYDRGEGRQTAVVYQDGVRIRAIDLSRVEEPYSFTVEWEGGYNMSDGAAPIACLPHRLVIQLEGGGDSGIDGVAG